MDNGVQQLIKVRIKNTIFFVLSVVLTLLFLFPQPTYAESANTVKLRAAIFPFNDMSARTLDHGIPVVLRSELSGYGFIEIIPVEKVTEQLLEIEPSLMWTGKEGKKDKGGILWIIKSVVIEKAGENISADFLIYGDLTRFGERWRIDAVIKEKDDPGDTKTLYVIGEKDEEIPERVSVLGEMIADWLKGKNLLYEAEEQIRRYRGGMITYRMVLKKMRDLLVTSPGSIPVRALLLDLYLEQKGEYSKEALQESLKIIGMYSAEKEDDTRYLLSLALDPFDVAAEAYEEKDEWQNAIRIRNDALKSFPFRNDIHRKGLGRDHYFSGIFHESQQQETLALENYEKAILFLKPSSEYFNRSRERIQKLKNNTE